MREFIVFAIVFAAALVAALAGFTSHSVVGVVAGATAVAAFVTLGARLLLRALKCTNAAQAPAGGERAVPMVRLTLAKMQTLRVFGPPDYARVLDRRRAEAGPEDEDCVVTADGTIFVSRGFNVAVLDDGSGGSVVLNPAEYTFATDYADVDVDLVEDGVVTYVYRGEAVNVWPHRNDVWTVVRDKNGRMFTRVLETPEKILALAKAG